MRKLFKFIAAGAAAAMAVSPASAATFIFDFGGSAPLNGPDGNSRSFSATNGAETVNVRVTGWSLEGTTVRDSYLGQFGSGLGVTSGDDGDGSDTRHTIENQTRIDFVLLQFDQTVELESAEFNMFNLIGGPDDNDATIGWGNTAIDWMDAPLAVTDTKAMLDALITSNEGSPGDGSAFRNINLGNNTGNIWMIAAAFPEHNGGRLDNFKLDALTVQNVQGVPEPATWAMLIFGFGMIGSALRRRKKVEANVSLA